MYSLDELRIAYLNGTVVESMWIDNDCTGAYSANEHDEYGDPKKVFSMHPDDLLVEALTLLGIPSEPV